jgi:hypothetical protein
MEEKYLYSTKFNKTSSLYFKNSKFSFNFIQVGIYVKFRWQRRSGNFLIINGKPL